MTGYFDYYVGANFRQANDYTAVAIVEEPVWVSWPRCGLADSGVSESEG